MKQEIIVKITYYSDNKNEQLINGNFRYFAISTRHFDLALSLGIPPLPGN